MIEITNVIPMNKNSLLAICDVRILPWKMTLHEVKIFEKGANRWLGMPSKDFTNTAGEKKYKELITFDNSAVQTKFRAQIMGAIDKYLAENPGLETPDVITDTEEAPF